MYAYPEAVRRDNMSTDPCLGEKLDLIKVNDIISSKTLFGSKPSNSYSGNGLFSINSEYEYRDKFKGNSALIIIPKIVEHKQASEFDQAPLTEMTFNGINKNESNKFKRERLTKLREKFLSKNWPYHDDKNALTYIEDEKEYCRHFNITGDNIDDINFVEPRFKTKNLKYKCKGYEIDAKEVPFDCVIFPLRKSVFFAGEKESSGENLLPVYYNTHKLYRIVKYIDDEVNKKVHFVFDERFQQENSKKTQSLYDSSLKLWNWLEDRDISSSNKAHEFRKALKNYSDRMLNIEICYVETQCFYQQNLDTEKDTFSNFYNNDFLYPEDYKSIDKDELANKIVTFSIELKDPFDRKTVSLPMTKRPLPILTYFSQPERYANLHQINSYKFWIKKLDHQTKIWIKNKPQLKIVRKLDYKTRKFKLVRLCYNYKLIDKLKTIPTFKGHEDGNSQLYSLKTSDIFKTWTDIYNGKRIDCEDFTPPTPKAWDLKDVSQPDLILGSESAFYDRKGSRLEGRICIYEEKYVKISDYYITSRYISF